MNPKPIPKRISAFLLCFALLVGLLPTSALAAETGAFTVTGDSGYSYSNGVLTVNDGANITISMASGATTPTTDRIAVAENATATITLNGVNIKTADATTNGDAHPPLNIPSGSILTINLEGENTLSGGNGHAVGYTAAPGIHVPEGATITIEGNGSLTATGGNSNGSAPAPGIGGQSTIGSSGLVGNTCGTVIILGGTVTATGGTHTTGPGGAGIGGSYSSGGNNGAGGTVIILGGTVTATGGQGGGGSSGANIGGGGNSPDRDDGQGIRPSGDGTYNVYGDVILPEGVTITIPEGVTVNIPSGTSLEVSEGATLTNNGTITGQGSLAGDGTVTNKGEMSVTNNDFIATVAVSVSTSPAAYNSTVTLTAKVTSGSEEISGGTVTFYRGEENNDNKLNSDPANVTSGTAAYTINTLDWAPGDYTITAVYTPAEGSNLLESSGTTQLTVTKAEQDTAPDSPSGTSSVTANSVTLNTVTGSGEGEVQYGYTTGVETSVPENRWQTGTEFTNLSAGTDYTFFARYAGNDNYEPSPASSCLAVTTLPGITTADLAAGYVGVEYSAALQASAASGKTVTWALASGSSLPAGLTLDSNSGSITGAPTTPGTFTFTVQATISGAGEGEMVSNTANLSITINAGTPLISITSGSGPYTYGDTITISGSIAASSAAPSNSINAITEPEKNQVGLYLGDTQLATATVGDDGKFTLTYDTSEKGITPGETPQTLTVRYGGSDTLNSGETTVSITLNPKPVTVSFVGETTKVYDGTSTAPTGLTLELDGVLTGDDVSVTYGPITYNTADVGESKAITASGISLSGNDAEYYALSDTTATTTGSITQSGSTLAVVPSSTSLTYGEALTIKVTPERSAANGINALTAQNTVELLTSDGTVLATATAADQDGAYTLTYDTTGKGLSTGQNTLTVSYGGNGNLAASTATVTVSLSAKPVTASVDGTPSKTFDGGTDVDVVLTFASDTLAGSDNLTGTISGNFSDANVGEGKSITLDTPTWSDPATAEFYNITLPDDVTGTITAAQIDGELTITGSPIPGGTLTANYTPTSGEEVSYQWNLDGEPIDGATGTTYTVRETDAGHAITVTATATDGNHTGSKTSAAITAGKGSQDAPAAGEGYTIDYRAETITASEGYELAATDTAGSGAASLTATPGGIIYVRLSETSTLNPSPWTAVDIPARPAAPTTPVGRDQYIGGVDATMEYRATFGTDQGWKDCGGHSVTGLSVGEYQVRVKATSSAFASETTTVTVYHNSGGTTTNPSYTPNVPETENGTVEVSPAKPKEGETVTVAAEPEDRYKVDTVIVTDEDGNPVEVTEGTDGTYTFVQPEGEVTIEVTFDVDLPFTDVPEDAWYIEGAKYVYGNYIMSGTGETTFSPSAPVSRGMIVQILYNLVGQPDVEGSSDFTDVDEDYWSSDAITWAVEHGVVGGYGDGTFGPDNNLTREQMAVILRNFAYQMGWDISASADLSKFTDISADSWAYDALAWAYAEGLMAGTSGSTMEPDGQASRAQIAVIMMRFCERYMED